MFKKVMMVILGIGAIISLVLLIGSAGALDVDCIDFSTGAKDMVIFTLLFVICISIDLILANKEDR